jgi:hypothetical protein
VFIQKPFVVLTDVKTQGVLVLNTITTTPLGNNRSGERRRKMIYNVQLNRHGLLQKVVLAAVPNYRYERCFVSLFKRMKLRNFEWRDESKTECRLVNLETLRLRNVRRGLVDIRSIPQGYALVKSGVYEGSLAVTHVFVNQEDFPKMEIRTEAVSEPVSQ